MTDPDHLTDADLEGRLRSLLADRAGMVTGPAPALPDVDRVDATRAGRLPRRRWAIVGAAAACAALVVAIVVATGNGPSTPDHVVTTEPTVPTSVRSGPTAVLFHTKGATDPEAVALDFLRVRLGDGSRATDAALQDQIDLQVGQAVAHQGTELVPVAWTRRGDHPTTTANTVWVRPAADASDVVGATIDGIDLDGVRYDTGQLTGEITAPDDIGRDGTTSRADLTRRFAMPLLEPDAADRTSDGEPVTATVPIGEPFSIPMTASGDLELTVRVTDEATGAVTGLAMTSLAGPSDPDMEGFEDLTPKEKAEVMEKKMREVPPASESPGCKEAGAFRMPELGGFPNEVPAAAATAVDDVIGTGATPADAAEALASALGIQWAVGDVELGDLDGAYVIVRLPGGRLVDLTVYDDPDLGAWKVTEAKTRGACRDFGGSNATPIGAADPKTTLGLPVVAGAVEGSIWYRTDGVTQRVAVTTHDIGAHWLNVAADQPEIESRITVLRDASGAAVLVDLSPSIDVSG